MRFPARDQVVFALGKTAHFLSSSVLSSFFSATLICIPSLLSLTGKHWVLPKAEIAGDASQIAANLLRARGIMHASPPFVPHAYAEGPKARERIERAIARKEAIAIFGDYDCDGITGVAQLLRFFRRRGVEPCVRLPHRLTEGYGLREETITSFVDKGITLLLTVDTGSMSGSLIERAAKSGIDTIVIDHHHLPSPPPSAYALLHPGMEEGYPFPHPSAAGVVFEVLHELEGGPWEEWDIDCALAMIGTIADVVPLQGANRALVREGLKTAARLPSCPLRRFLQSLVQPGSTLTSMDVAFRIAPRINAAGRMADPMIALTCLLDDRSPLEQITSLNVQRQQEVLRAHTHARSALPGGEIPPCIVVADASYSPGIVGLIAGKLTEQFGRPSVVASIVDGTCRASARSIPGYSIIEGITRCSDLLHTYGGHAQAAGCTFPLSALAQLQERLTQDVRLRLPAESLVPTLAVDCVLPLSSATTDLCASLNVLEPFGQGNPEPTFLVEGARLSSPRRVGSDGKHLQALLGHCKVIGFHFGPLIDHASSPLDLLCRLTLDEWNGVRRPQLAIKDMRVAGGVRKEREVLSM